MGQVGLANTFVFNTGHGRKAELGLEKNAMVYVGLLQSP